MAGLGRGWFYPRQSDPADNSSPVTQTEADVWRGNATTVEFSGLSTAIDRLEQSLQTPGDSYSPAAQDEWEQVRRQLDSLEAELGRDEK
jgi:hypothetical protein